MYKLSFDSLDALIVAAEGKSPLEVYQRGSRGGLSDSFYGNMSYSDAILTARDGWKVGAEKISRAMLDCSISGRSVSYESDVTGEYFDMGDVLAGVPDCWRYECPDEKRGFVDVFVGTSIPSSVKCIFRRGAAVCNLVDTLENQGYRVRVVAVSTGKHEDTFEAQTTIKHYHDALDVDKLAFCFAHLAFSRRIIFSLRECQSLECVRACGSRLIDSYGYAEHNRPSGCKDSDLWIPSDMEFSNDDDARKWILKMVASVAK